MKSSIITSTEIGAATSAPRNAVVDTISGIFGAVRRAAADRALNRQLADMDDALLRDIGLGDDEIYRVRQGGRLIPRNWR